MRVHILTIGDELLIGQVLDTNAQWMAALLTESGVEVQSKSTIGDEKAELLAELKRIGQNADVVIMTGGLGPTRDDVTKNVLVDLLDDSLEFHEATWLRLQNFLKQYNRQANDMHKQQCYLPSCAQILINTQGTAPGMWMEKDNTVYISLPGVPYEMKALMKEQVIPKLESEYKLQQSYRRTIMTIGRGESDIAERIEDIEAALPKHISLAYLPRLSRVRLRLTGTGGDVNAVKKEVDRVCANIVKRIKPLVYGYDDIEFEQHLIHLLNEKNMMLATAESCTGGLIAQKMTSISGASSVFSGSVVAYSNSVKMQLLQVKSETLDLYGAVSEQTVKEMVCGVLDATGADIAIATSGIAGPTGGTPTKPVGTIWIAVGTPEKIETRLLQLSRDRSKNIEITALSAMNLLRRTLSA